MSYRYCCATHYINAQIESSLMRGLSIKYIFIYLKWFDNQIHVTDYIHLELQYIFCCDFLLTGIISVI